jgi:hypothetical protein
LSPCSARATGVGGLDVPVTPTYASNTNAGTATSSASYTGGGNYLASVGSSTFQIAPVTPSASVSCPASVQYTGSAVTPCSGSVSGPGLTLSVTPSYSSNLVGTATATLNYAGGGNFGPTSASTTFQILYVQTGLFAAPLSGAAQLSTQSFISSGSPVTVRATLSTASGAGATGASGNLIVQDLGPGGPTTPVTVVSVANAMTPGTAGVYSYTLSTTGFVSTHYYGVYVTWNDGSTTFGRFYVP